MHRHFSKLFGSLVVGAFLLPVLALTVLLTERQAILQQNASASQTQYCISSAQCPAGDYCSHTAGHHGFMYDDVFHFGVCMPSGSAQPTPSVPLVPTATPTIFSNATVTPTPPENNQRCTFQSDCPTGQACYCQSPTGCLCYTNAPTPLPVSPTTGSSYPSVTPTPLASSSNPCGTQHNSGVNANGVSCNFLTTNGNGSNMTFCGGECGVSGPSNYLYDCQYSPPNYSQPGISTQSTTYCSHGCIQAYNSYNPQTGYSSYASHCAPY